jgi:hypothetical protein
MRRHSKERRRSRERPSAFAFSLRFFFPLCSAIFVHPSNFELSIDKKLTTMSFVGLALIPMRLRILRVEPSANGGREAGARGGAAERAASASSASAATSSRAAAIAVAADEGIDEIELSGLRPPTLPPPTTAVGESLSAIANDESTYSFVF